MRKILRMPARRPTMVTRQPADWQSSGFAAAWQPLVTGRIEAVPVDGDHNEMTEPAALTAIAPVLGKYLSTEG
ncbi:hypothetical protein [Amycolatopsis sulphurea]|uniref:hypothetical protein n=1 Tax=Amycolatopsis sulphurea TaxID=76022 RepID=UPI0011459C76|nr:hypothetical protein [Amycolatopsis sulphurea]